jgi:hypothetical protein
MSIEMAIMIPNLLLIHKPNAPKISSNIESPYWRAPARRVQDILRSTLPQAEAMPFGTTGSTQLPPIIFAMTSSECESLPW